MTRTWPGSPPNTARRTPGLHPLVDREHPSASDWSETEAITRRFDDLKAVVDEFGRSHLYRRPFSGAARAHPRPHLIRSIAAADGCGPTSCGPSRWCAGGLRSIG